MAFAAAAVTPLALLAAPAGAAPPPDAPAATANSVPGAWIVTLEPGASPERVANEHARQHGARVHQVYRHAVNGYAARMSDQRAARVAQDPRVASVERDQVVTVAAQGVPTGIDRVDAELAGTVAGDGTGAVDVDVAVLDTGIDVDHPDLDVRGGYNCVSSDRGAYDDGHGHGTHVAGTIGAKDDAEGVVGVAPGAALWAVRVLDDSGSGSWSSIICGIDWVTANKSTIEVANMSLGGSGKDGRCKSSALHAAICRSVGAGITYAVAAGNSSANANNYVPATYAEVITVSALADFDGAAGGLGSPTCRSDVDDTFANFSNYGSDVDLIAPGVCITSSWPGGGTNTISGTSMASPHVAGAAALYKAANPGASPSQVKSALQSAGNLGWNNVDDRDSTKEKLLNVDAF